MALVLSFPGARAGHSRAGVTLRSAQMTPGTGRRWGRGSPSVCTSDFTHKAGPSAGPVGLGCQLVETPGATPRSLPARICMTIPSKGCTANMIGKTSMKSGASCLWGTWVRVLKAGAELEVGFGKVGGSVLGPGSLVCQTNGQGAFGCWYFVRGGKTQSLCPTRPHPPGRRAAGS